MLQQQHQQQQRGERGEQQQSKQEMLECETRRQPKGKNVYDIFSRIFIRERASYECTPNTQQIATENDVTSLSFPNNIQTTATTTPLKEKNTNR